MGLKGGPVAGGRTTRLEDEGRRMRKYEGSKLQEHVFYTGRISASPFILGENRQTYKQLVRKRLAGGGSHDPRVTYRNIPIS